MPLLELLPDGIGDAHEWLALPSGTAPAAVLDLNGPDGDASYIRSTGNPDDPTAGVLSLFTFQRAPQLPRPILSVSYITIRPWARRAGAGAQFLAGVIKSGAAQLVFPSVQVTSPAYAALEPSTTGWLSFTDPATGKSWTVAAALAAQVGVFDSTPNAAHEMRVTKITKQVWVEWDSRGAAVRYESGL